MCTERLRIRDFFRVNNKIFSVVEYSRGKKVKSLLRYIRDKDGNREFRGQRYKKLSFGESYEELKGSRFLKEIGNRKVQIVDKREIDEIFRPNNPGSLDNMSKELIELFSKNIPRGKLGITGSRLLGMEKKDSDIDFVVYGEENFQLARKQLFEEINNGKLKKLDLNEWKEVYNKRNPPFSFNTYLKHSKRKQNKAKIGEKKFDLLYVRSDEDDFPEDRKIKDLGEVKEIEAKVIRDKYLFDSPAIYRINHPDFREVLSYTHTFVGQVFENEIGLFRGKEVLNEDILLIGTSRKPNDEYIVSKSLDFSSLDSV